MSKQKKILKAPLRIAVTVLLLGMLAKILQWPFAKELVILGFVAMVLLYSIRFWKKSEKQFLDYVKLVLVSFWATNGILRMMDFPYTLFFQIVTGAAFITWFVMEGTAYFMDEDRHTKNSSLRIWWNIAMVLGTLSIIMGSLMKILQWQFANVLLALGIVMVGVYIVKDLFIATKIDEQDSSSEEFQL